MLDFLHINLKICKGSQFQRMMLTVPKYFRIELKVILPILFWNINIELDFSRWKYQTSFFISDYYFYLHLILLSNQQSHPYPQNLVTFVSKVMQIINIDIISLNLSKKRILRRGLFLFVSVLLIQLSSTTLKLAKLVVSITPLLLILWILKTSFWHCKCSRKSS